MSGLAHARRGMCMFLESRHEAPAGQRTCGVLAGIAHRPGDHVRAQSVHIRLVGVEIVCLPRRWFGRPTVVATATRDELGVDPYARWGDPGPRGDALATQRPGGRCRCGYRGKSYVQHLFPLLGDACAALTRGPLAEQVVELGNLRLGVRSKQFACWHHGVRARLRGGTRAASRVAPVVAAAAGDGAFARSLVAVVVTTAAPMAPGTVPAMRV